MFIGTVFVNLICLMVHSSLGDWVEVPQFSDKEKVYRIPLRRYDNVQKYLESANINGYGNWSRIGENNRRRFEAQFGPPEKTEADQTTALPEVVASSDSIPVQEDATIGPSDYQPDEIVTVSSVYNDKIVINGDQPFQAPNEQSSASEEPPEDYASSESPPEDYATSENPPEDDASSEKRYEEKNKKSDRKTSFFDYVPIELFKKVHAILRSHSATEEGRINYLKNLEEALHGEIEKRLVPVFSNVRTKRDSRGDHGWDDHEKGVGFPSLEGALMAIAFLTFAVYLIQMVMMLFRNLGNNGAAATPMVAFNRAKRSIEQFNNDTARILEYLDSFAKNPYPE